jgi:hypothetical protein
MSFLSINNHTIIFIMKLLVKIQVPISKSKDILITICIWIKGNQEKKLMSQKWTIRLCTYLVITQCSNLSHLFKTILLNYNEYFQVIIFVRWSLLKYTNMDYLYNPFFCVECAYNCCCHDIAIVFHKYKSFINGILFSL